MYHNHCCHSFVSDIHECRRNRQDNEEYRARLRARIDPIVITSNIVTVVDLTDAGKEEIAKGTKRRKRNGKDDPRLLSKLSKSASNSTAGESRRRMEKIQMDSSKTIEKVSRPLLEN
jgi:hypothetical protein